MRAEELERLERRHRQLEADWKRLRAVEPYGCMDAFGILDSLRIFLSALTETRAGTSRRHKRMSALARQAVTVSQAIAVTRRALAALDAQWEAEFRGRP